MNRLINILLLLLAFCATAGAAEEVYVDDRGVMRFVSSQEEVSFYGINYTLPFAHAYRAAGYLNQNRKECIDRDVYHIARLGVNAYRIHIWDVEISAADGTLIDNDHLDLLDYLIYRLKERNIYTLVTLQTNFGNGYPERNINTGAYSYNYDKCSIHSDPEAVKAQERYVSALISHVNRYTGTSYKSDPSIIGFEINNEPCHSGTADDTRQYINRMYDAIRNTDCKKPVFYNASHNKDHVEAYFSSSIEGVTYQWYPVGLVKGSTRRGNFLPHVDSYAIPFDTLAGYDSKAKLIYEFDPADNLYSYLFPAVARTFRSAGFQWITQFAYDPLALAHVNTEYQTHYLNLIYTPSKAISMRIAAEAAYTIPRNARFPAYPADTVFGNFLVSYKRDLSLLNTKNKYIYTNDCNVEPLDPKSLTEVIGCGSSPVVKYTGTGAYFIEKLEKGVWRLEVMPDVIYLDDPFRKASMKKQVASVMNVQRDITVKLPDLGNEFIIKGINRGNEHSSKAKDGLLAVTPGTYLLSVNDKYPADFKRLGNIDVCEYVGAEDNTPVCALYHKSPDYLMMNKESELYATVAGSSHIDSVVMYTDEISFWKSDNKGYRFEKSSAYTYKVNLPAEIINNSRLRYNIVVFTPDGCHTYPGNNDGHPLDWDYFAEDYYSVPVMGNRIYITDKEAAGAEYYTVPEWSDGGQQDFYTRFYFPHKLGSMLSDDIRVCMKGTDLSDNSSISVITSDGYSYGSSTFIQEDGYLWCKLKDLTMQPTILLPHAYPVFLEKHFTPEKEIPLGDSDIEYIQIQTEKPFRSTGTEIWIEYL